MPVIMIDTLNLLEEQKQFLAKKFTALLSEQTKVPPDRIYVFFGGLPLDSIAAGGVLNSELPQSVINSFVTRYSTNLSSKTIIVTRMKAKDGMEDAAKQTLTALVKETVKEPGTISYDLYQQNFDNLSYYVLVEVWRGPEAIDAHMKTAHFQELMAKAPGLFEKGEGMRDVFEVNNACVYDPTQGALPDPATVVVRMKTKEGMGESAKQALITMMTKTRKEAGVVSFDPYQNALDPSSLLLFQIFHGTGAIESHRATPHFNAFDSKRDTLFQPIESPMSPFEILFCTPYAPTEKRVPVTENAVLGDGELMEGLKKINPDFGELCVKSSGELYGKSLLDQKTKVFIAIATDVVEQITGKPFENHISMAKKQGITRAELEELFLFLTLYAGFNKVGLFYAALNQAWGPE